MKYGTISMALLALALSGANAAYADVKDGVDAWAQGDFSRAVAEWQPLARQGDADAQFNLGQAYKLGRGVPMNLATALEWYRKAAVQGHARAEDNCGLLLFQQNRRAEAMPYLRRSAMRGEPRAQYLVGAALFNGDLMQRDWINAYALMSLAAASGLPQAASALAQMDSHVTEDQRRQGIALAQAMTGTQKEQADVPASAAPAKTAPPRRPMPTPVKQAPVPPSVPASPPATAVPAGQDSGWRVQLGAFSETDRAEAHWHMVSTKVSALSRHRHIIEPTAGLFRLQAIGFSDKGGATALCSAIKDAGADCIVKR